MTRTTRPAPNPAAPTRWPTPARSSTRSTSAPRRSRAGAPDDPARPPARGHPDDRRRAAVARRTRRCRRVARPAVRQAIERLVADFDGVDGTIRRGFELREVGGGWRFYVRADLDAVVEQFVEAERPSRLSQAALETLAVVAYKQPITRSQIAAIRAVNVDGVVRTLVARGLIEESFTDSETGAINYVTSDLLLQQLGINSLDELPLISPLLDDGADGFEQNEGIPDGRV